MHQGSRHQEAAAEAAAEAKALRTEAAALRSEAQRLRDEKLAKEHDLSEARKDLATLRRTTESATLGIQCIAPRIVPANSMTAQKLQ